MIWPFKRKPRPITPSPINEDWKPGDLAECVEKKGWFNGATGAVCSGPEFGDVMLVIGVKPMRSRIFGDRWMIQFNRDPAWYLATAFRKVPPLNTLADAEFTARIKALKPKRVGV